MRFTGYLVYSVIIRDTTSQVPLLYSYSLTTEFPYWLEGAIFPRVVAEQALMNLGAKLQYPDPPSDPVTGDSKVRVELKKGIV